MHQKEKLSKINIERKVTLLIINIPEARPNEMIQSSSKLAWKFFETFFGISLFKHFLFNISETKSFKWNLKI